MGTVRDAQWQDVPHLAWVIGCAYGAGPAWLRRLGALVLAPTLGVVTVVACRGRGRVLHADRRAVLVVHEPVSWVRMVGTALVGVLVALPGTMAAAVVLLVASLALPPAFGSVVLVAMFAPLAPVLISLPRSAPCRRALSRARRALPHAAQVETLAAWPQGCGHGRALLAGLAPALGDYPRPLLALARTAELAAWYERETGLTPIEPGSLVLLRPAACTPPIRAAC